MISVGNTLTEVATAAPSARDECRTALSIEHFSGGYGLGATVFLARHAIAAVRWRFS